jgi:hypothetical protein
MSRQSNVVSDDLESEDRSMRFVEYALAFLAIGAALILAFLR